MERLQASAVESGDFEFGMVVTGDDNDGDCTHRGFSVTMIASLVPE